MTVSLCPKVMLALQMMQWLLNIYIYICALSKLKQILVSILIFVKVVLSLCFFMMCINKEVQLLFEAVLLYGNVYKTICVSRSPGLFGS